MKKTITINNPKCMKCSKRKTCNNKTFMFAWVEEDDCKDYRPLRALEDISEPLSVPIKLTPEMIQKQITKQLLNKQLEIGVDLGKGYSQQGFYNR